MSLKKRVSLYFFIAFVSLQVVHAQVIQPGSFDRDYYELLILNNPELPRPISIHPSIISQYKPDSALSWNIWGDDFMLPAKNDLKSDFYWINPYFDWSANTITPRGYNDGAIWSGKGSNVALSGGFAGHVGILHFSFVPIVTYAQNLPFDIPSNPTSFEKSPYSYPFNNKIDRVERYGDGSYSKFNLGQSEIRLVYKKMTLGLSTENFKWGPSIWNPLLMSMNAPGIPHIDIGTAAPIKTKIGKIEGKWYWGAAYESDYFDDDPINDRKYVTGISIGYEPSFAPGLNLGVNRVLYSRWASGDLGLSDAFAAITSNTFNDSLKNDDYDQMVSLMVKYRFPSVGFEAYIEYARNDFESNLTGWFEEFDRSRALVWGLMKTFQFKNEHLLKINYEYTTLSANQNQLLPYNVNPPYYVHTVVPNGYTNQGQIMGAGIGTGSNGALLKIDYFHPKGKLGVMYSKIRFNDDYFVNAYSNQPVPPYPADFEISAGIDYLRYFDKFSLRPQVMWVYRKNWYYRNDVEVHSFHFGLQTQYRF